MSSKLEPTIWHVVLASGYLVLTGVNGCPISKKDAIKQGCMSGTILLAMILIGKSINGFLFLSYVYMYMTMGLCLVLHWALGAPL